MKNYWLKKNEKKNENKNELPVFRGKFQEASTCSKNRPYCYKGLKDFAPAKVVDPVVKITDKDLVYTYDVEDYWVPIKTNSSSWRTPVIEELPQGDKTHVMQVKVCPSTGVKHNFAPYGTSLIETARVSNQRLKLMQDAMFAYRLARCPTIYGK